MFVIGCFSLPAFAEESSTATSSSSSSSTANTSKIQEIRELLNAISYDEYLSGAIGVSPAKAGNTVVIDAVNDLVSEQSSDWKVDTYGGVEALYTSGSGSVTWAFEVPETAMYTIVIEYYAVEGKPAAIERVLRINDEVPFKEARYLAFQKNWINLYQDGVYTGKEDESTVRSEGEAAGLVAKINADGNLAFEYPEIWTEAASDFCQKYSIRFMKVDVWGNELRPDAEQAPIWSEYQIKDSMGFYSSPFEFVFEAGKVNTITLEGKNEDMAIKSITLCPAEEIPTYEEYRAALGDVSNGTGSIKIEAEFTNTTTDKTIYALEDRSSAATSPSSPEVTLLNTIGESKWQTAGQAITYKFRLGEGESGLYDIVTRFRQNVLDGMYVNRALYIYSGEGVSEGEAGYYNGIPFEEAKALVYNYSDNWQVTDLRNSDSDDGYQIYFKEGVVYTIKLEVTLGEMGEIVNKVQECLDSINDDYLSIIQLTGTTPDADRDYGFKRIMYNVLVDMNKQSRILDNEPSEAYPEPGVAQVLTELAGQKSANVGTLQKIADLLHTMAVDESEIAQNLSRLKSYIGTLGTFLSDAKTQPLQMDYLIIQSPEEDMPKAGAGFFKALWHEVKSFFASFTRDYNAIGATTTEEVEGVEVWMASGRDQFQVVRNLINNDFTNSTGITVDLKLVAGGTLLPSILAGEGPDVYLSLGQDDVINYAIRSAVLPIEENDGFEEVTKSFTNAAMLVLGIEDAEGVRHYYGLPEVQSFAMMFVRTDVLADLYSEMSDGDEVDENVIPETWEDVMALIPLLQAREMEIGLTTEYRMFLYQMGGDLFADDGMRINLDSKVGLESFEKMCKLFTDYKFPYVYDAANRFRTGEMPILIGDYTGLYNQLKVFATEIEGLWEFVPLPGIENEDGVINNQSISGVAATVMVKGAEDQREDAWEFMKWYTGKDCQTEYTNEMVAIMGPSAKHPTANIDALESLPWTQEEFAQISAQIEGHDGPGGLDGLAAIPNYPGAYIVARYTNFAFLSAYNDKEDPKQALLSYINTINKEISRKRTEFGLETLEQGETLASKRLSQAQKAVDSLVERGFENTALLNKVRSAIKSDDMTTIREAAEEVAALVGESAKTDLKGDAMNIKTMQVQNKDIADTNRFGEDNVLYFLSVALSDAANAMSKY